MNFILSINVDNINYEFLKGTQYSSRKKCKCTTYNVVSLLMYVCISLMQK